MAKLKPKPKSPRKKVIGGSRWGTRWVSNREGVQISWPSIPGAGLYGGLGLLACLAYGACMHYFLEFVPKKFQFHWFWTLSGTIICICLLVSTRLMRESFSLSRKRAQRTRWPGIFRPRQAVPAAQVINVIIRLVEIDNGDIENPGTTRVGIVNIRVRRSNGIEWWNLGEGLDWSDADSIGKCLSRFVSVRVIRAE